MAATLEAPARALLTATNYCHVSTRRPDATILTVVVWCDVDGEHVVLNSAEGRAWPANARRDGGATLNVMNLENPYEYVEIVASLADYTAEGADEVIDALAKKYMGVDRYPAHRADETRITLRFAPERVRHRRG
jgi:PPOX class probable F420-dependent enzyme